VGDELGVTANAVRPYLLLDWLGHAIAAGAARESHSRARTLTARQVERGFVQTPSICTIVHMDVQVHSSAAHPFEPPSVDASRKSRRARRFDPNRKDRLLDVALDVIAERGVAGTTHRHIAAAADVSPGSLTYYFDGMSDLLEQAFRKHAIHGAALYEQHFDEVRTRSDLVEAITRLIVGNSASSERDSVITFELYLAAKRDSALRAITEQWMSSSREVLRRYMDASTARGVDALIEGLTIHMLLSTRPVDRTQVTAYVDRAVGESALRFGEAP
jgi:DNA-binding transcriptional regulator YbjK